MKIKIFFFLFTFGFFSFFSTKQLDSQVKNLGIPVKAAKPLLKEISNQLELPATLIANESVEITSVISEKIKKINFMEGSFVKQNHLLVEFIDSEEKAVLKQIDAELEEAEINYQRALQLSEKGNISQLILDNRIMLKKKLLGKHEEIKAKIDDLYIKAPFDGVTGIRNFSEGAFIKPGDVITVIYEIDKLKIQAFAPENFINKIKIGDTLIISIPSKKETNIQGKVYVIDPLIDPKTRTFKIVGRINNKRRELKPGMMVTLKINLNPRESTLIPESSIVSLYDKSYVYVVKKESVIKKEVVTGKRLDGRIEIIQGLNLTDLVIYEGINKIQDGSKIILK